MCLRITRTWYDICINVICIGLLFGTVIYLCSNWSNIPEKIPGHYNAYGVIDRWGNRKELLITPVAAWIMYIGLTVLGNFPETWNTGVHVTEQNKERVYRILKDLIETVKLLLIATFSFLAINSSLSKSLPVWFLPVSLLSVLGSLVFFIVKLVKAR